MEIIYFLLLMIIIMLLLLIMAIIQVNKNLINKLTVMQESIIKYILLISTKEFTKVKVKDVNKK